MKGVLLLFLWVCLVSSAVVLLLGNRSGFWDWVLFLLAVVVWSTWMDGLWKVTQRYLEADR